MDLNILLPARPRTVLEEVNNGVYEIDNLYPGYGPTLGNALRRIILSSLPGAAITSLKIDGVPHEFSTIEGVKEDVVSILLNLKKIRFRMLTDEPQQVTLSVKGPKKVTAADINVPGQVEVKNEDQYIAELTSKTASLDISMTIEKGLGFVQKEALQKAKTEIGTIAVDALFSPIQRVSYEVENMRVGDRTNHNRLRVSIETDGSLTPRAALDRAIEIMIKQLQAILPETEMKDESTKPAEEEKDMTDVLKTRIDALPLSQRTVNALTAENIRTVGGLVRKKEEDIVAVKGMGDKGLKEIKEALASLGVSLKV
ncbi:DNA-directed RNA polymerase subunit alpha [Candidatus Nomurabacteria bacterium RIFCSPHIGHO2_01_FULL_39_9]|uniref:DNA-directed RNA polymerase subunit alpha n=1 Tax=Candidatus Nomurabacteria bacterium RIFCSPHIGHO2_01_FULL_39_9 TaxID=1801735 RepID=A0A1F6UVW0_9BACT|nr:MAG: DNA-directed RNA polymerase subunit alpha [Candidatus Nomurabacteria bacterium RIFCSPHIGHO2_01_FULL_39_9]